ncbi:MAG: hypothetical protein WEE51_03170, partial [Pirellulaceae bacterium]
RATTGSSRFVLASISALINIAEFPQVEIGRETKKDTGRSMTGIPLIRIFLKAREGAGRFVAEKRGRRQARSDA